MTEQLFVLGSGFSKAYSESMPTVNELAGLLKCQNYLAEEPYASLTSDPELLLTYLSWEQPWQKRQEHWLERSHFERTQREIATSIARSEHDAFEQAGVVDWLKDLIEYFHEHKQVVISFNYDTIIERVCHQIQPRSFGTFISDFAFYRLPLTLISSRVKGGGHIFNAESFHLIKLHGSINWYYSGMEQFPGEQVYLRSVDTESPFHDGIDERNPEYGNKSSEVAQLLVDKTQMIIPPVAEKSRFYSNQTIRSLWWAAREAMQRASQMFFVGYSLPPTDLSTKMMLKAHANPDEVFIVNRDPDAVEDRYYDVFPESEIKNEFRGETAVKDMVRYLTS